METQAAAIAEFDYVIVNEVFETAVAEMCSIFTASRLRKDAQVALRNFQAAIASGERLTQDAQYLLHLFESGQGTLGGFNRDVQLFDELKDVARILKQQLHRVIIKSRK